MFSLKVSFVVCWLAMVGLEAKPAPAIPVGTFSYSSQLGSNSIAAPATAQQPQQQPADATRTTSRGRLTADPTDIASYMPAEDTPEVQAAKEKFFDAFKQQTDLISEVREDGLWSVQPYTDYYDNFEEAGQAEGDYEYEEDEEEGDGGEEEDEDEDEEDSDEEDDEDDSSSSSSSSESEEDSDEDDEDDDDEDEEDEDEEDEDDEEDDDEDEEDEEDSDEDDEEDSSSSSEEDYGDDSSSSSSSSSSEEDGDPALLSMQALQALQPKQVEDTPEVEAAKKEFFDQYKAQLELVSNDV